MIEHVVLAVFALAFGIPLMVLLVLLVRSARILALRAEAVDVIRPDASMQRSVAVEIERLTRRKVAAGELAAYASVTAAEYAWQWASIDPAVIAAADFSSTAAIESGFEFARYIHEQIGAADLPGFQARLLGYVGEQQAADLLISQGHVVQAAESANEPIWDLLVDGQAVNVKTVASIASVEPEAAAHPDVTYLVPEDAAGAAHDNIVALSGFEHGAAKEALQEGLASAKGETALDSLGLHVPWITLGFAAYRNYKLVQYGKDPLIALQHGATEVVCRGVGVWIGAKVGAIAGTVLGAMLGGTAIPLLMPLGGVIGAVLGACAGGSAAEAIKALRLERAQEELQGAIQAFGRSFAPKLKEIHDCLVAPLRRMQTNVEHLSREVEARKTGWRWWVWPDFYTVLLDEAVKVGRREVQSEVQKTARVTSILTEARQTRRYEKVGLLMANCPEVRERVGYDPLQLRRLQKARAAVLFERRQLNPRANLPK